MRTTLDIDDDILLAAKVKARDRGVSTGRVVSDWARKALSQPFEVDPKTGFALLPRRGVVVTMELVNKLRDEEP